MNTENRQRVQDLIEQYKQEMLAAHRKTAAPPPENRLDRDYPLPDIKRDLAAMASTPPPAENPPTPNPADRSREEAAPRYPYNGEELQGQVPFPQEPERPPAEADAAYTGTLQVFVFTAQEAEPLEGAHVTVTRPGEDGDILVASTSTDRDGLTPDLLLPSVSPAMTMRPQSGRPYTPYDIRVDRDGFVTTIYRNVPVYGNNRVTQPAAMIPLLPGDSNAVPRVFQSGGPANL